MHGIPETVISDNGPQFISDEYDKFVKSWGSDHDFSSLEYPQSNGMVEWKIQTVKKTLRKANFSNNDPYLVILALRTRPQQQWIETYKQLYHLPPNYLGNHIIEMQKIDHLWIKDNQFEHIKINPGHVKV